MHRFLAEFVNDYSTYSFGYCEYAVPDEGEDVGAVYAAGFLPFSGDVRLREDVFYRARSLRVELARLRFDKKRRYHQRALEKEAVTLKVWDKSAFLKSADASFRKNAFAWLEQRFEQAYLNNERLEYVLGKPFLNTILEARVHNRTVAYALVCRWATGYHFWYSFYDSNRFPKLSLGKWLMGRSLEWSAEEGLTHAYLGTAYGEKSAYKDQGVQPVAFHDGNAWIDDKDRLAYLRERDALSPGWRLDLFKENIGRLPPGG
jgi:arginyl-tRNA--protein-N-Asp/Glu arginylyltransferase